MNLFRVKKNDDIEANDLPIYEVEMYKSTKKYTHSLIFTGFVFYLVAFLGAMLLTSPSSSTAVTPDVSMFRFVNYESESYQVRSTPFLIVAVCCCTLPPP